MEAIVQMSTLAGKAQLRALQPARREQLDHARRRRGVLETGRGRSGAGLTHGDAPLPDARRRRAQTRQHMFADLSGFTALSETLDPEGSASS